MNIAEVNQQTQVLVNAGHRIFQIHRFGENEYAHVARLEKWADLPLNAAVIDMGSGTGELAKIFKRIRPDLTFSLVNISSLQLDYSDPDMQKYCCDFRCVPVADASFDAALFCFSIGHEDIAEGLKEAARLVRTGGVVFIYDMARVAGDNRSMLDAEYQVHPRHVMESAAGEAGLKLDFFMEPQDSGEYGRSVLGDAYSQVFHGTIPAIWRFTK